MSELDKLNEELDSQNSSVSQEDLNVSKIFGDGPLAEGLERAIKSSPNKEAIQDIKESSQELQSHVATTYREFINFMKEASDYFFNQKREAVGYQLKGEKTKTKIAKTKADIIEEESKQIIIDLQSSKIYTQLQLSKLNNFIQKVDSTAQLDTLKTAKALLRDQKQIEEIQKKLQGSIEFRRAYEDTEIQLNYKISDLNAKRIDSGEDPFDVLTRSDRYS